MAPVGVLTGIEHAEPVEYEVGWALEQECMRWRTENIVQLPGVKPRLFGFPAHMLLTVPTALI
jgi:hypothetical protein